MKLWREERIALLKSVKVAREEALSALADEHRRVMSLSRQEAIQEVLKGEDWTLVFGQLSPSRRMARWT